jgi:hypothetical protein
LGVSGVDLFFVISGFIMVYTTHDKKISPLQFFLPQAGTDCAALLDGDDWGGLRRDDCPGFIKKHRFESAAHFGEFDFCADAVARVS